MQQPNSGTLLTIITMKKLLNVIKTKMRKLFNIIKTKLVSFFNLPELEHFFTISFVLIIQ